MHALRSQLATANERLSAVDSMAERVAKLRCSLAAITAAANWGKEIWQSRQCTGAVPGQKCGRVGSAMAPCWDAALVPS